MPNLPIEKKLQNLLSSGIKNTIEEYCTARADIARKQLESCPIDQVLFYRGFVAGIIDLAAAINLLSKQQGRKEEDPM